MNRGPVFGTRHGGFGKRILLAALTGAAVLLVAAPPGTAIAALADNHYCDGCTPPLRYDGGPVLGTDSTTGLTVTPVYWAPSGTSYKFPGNYETIINGFVSNVAAASGSNSNVFSVDQEYYEVFDGAEIYSGYDIKAGSPVVDTDPFPSNGCKPIGGNTVCLTDQQLRNELTTLSQKSHLTTDPDHFYPVFLPTGVETQDRDGTNSVSAYCGYHRSFGSNSSFIDYADIPYETADCPSGQSPNGNMTADGAVNTLSHELNEAVTDPLDNAASWQDSSGYEIADICAQSYGPALGSTNPNSPGNSEYNQVINGGKYYLQSEFSNLAYTKGGPGKGCVQSQADAQNPSQPSATTVSSVFADAFPTRLAANGKATSDIRVVVADRNQDAVSGDPITFQTYARSGKGQCGKLNKTRVKTDDNGAATVTYTSSSANVPCEVAAIDGQGGISADSVIFQGSSKALAPTILASYPSSVTAGGTGDTFTIVENNPSSNPLPGAQINFSLYPDSSKSPKVDSTQVQMSYSTDGSAGPFTPIALSGDTGNGDEIQGYEGPLQGTTLAPNSKVTYTIHLSVAGNAPAEKKGAPLMDIESYLEQIDSASGTGTVLDDSLAYPLQVKH